jgi:hypothetical protein
LFNVSNDGDLTTTFNATIKIDRLDNIITYVKQAMKLGDKNAAMNSGIAAPINSVSATPVITPSTTPTTPTQAGTAPDQPFSTINATPSSSIPEIDYASIIKDLAKKNPSTSGSISVFEIKREKGGDFMVNDTSFSEIIIKLITPPASSDPAAGGNPAGEANPAAIVPGVSGVNPTNPVPPTTQAPAVQPNIGTAPTSTTPQAQAPIAPTVPATKAPTPNTPATVLPAPVSAPSLPMPATPAPAAPKAPPAPAPMPPATVVPGQ